MSGPAFGAAVVDHLVVAAATLEQGAAWCEATLGVAPGPGGKHPNFGTHNRLLKIEGPGFSQVYLEIIALDPEAGPPTRPRWFGLDGTGLQASLARQGPRLAHVVARTDALDACLAALAAAGLDAGEGVAASRQTVMGLLQWRIAVRRDGALLCGGALPTLIEWSGPHPTQAMAATAVRLRSLQLAGVPPAAAAALGGLGSVDRPGSVGSAGGWTPVAFVAQSAPALRATFDTPRGPVTLESA